MFYDVLHDTPPRMIRNAFHLFFFGIGPSLPQCPTIQRFV